MSLKLKVSVLQ